MTKDEALKLSLEALDKYGFAPCDKEEDWQGFKRAITAIKEALAQPEQEPVAWLITDEKINSLQVDSIQRLIDRARHANMTDIKLRINGQDEWHQADWLKHLTRTTPPQRTWVGLTRAERFEIEKAMSKYYDYQHECKTVCLPEFAAAIEAKLKEKNT